LWSAIGGIFSGVVSIYQSIVGPKQAKKLAKKQYSLQSSLITQEYQAKSSLLTQEKEATLEILGAQKSQPAPVSLQGVNPETSFFGLESIASSPNFLLYAMIGLGLILLLLFLRKKRK